MTEKTQVWLANTLRFTVFPTPDFELDETWWEKLIGEKPDTVQLQPKTGVKQYSGKWEEGQLILNAQHTRLDWLYVPDESAMLNDGIPDLGDFSAQVVSFQQAIKQWLTLDNAPNAVRLAFGAVLLIPVEILQDGYELLQAKFLSFSMNWNNASDFLYQVNRKHPSALIDGLLVNRLSKWSVIRQTKQQIIPASQAINEYFAIRLELDINTASEYFGRYSPEEIQNLLNELIDLASEISVRGDIE